MARLPSERYLVQDIGGQVVLFEDGTERELARFPAADGGAAQLSQKVIAMDPELGDEDKCFAHFWSGYFHAHATGMRKTDARIGALMLRPAMLVTPEEGDMVLEQEGDPPRVIVSYKASDGTATAQAQKAIHDSELPGDARMLAHFWCGYFWARHGAEG